MNGTFFLGLGSGLSCTWGIVHLFFTRKIISDFGEISKDSGRIAAGAWMAEGFLWIFIGVLIGILTHVFGGDSYTVFWVARICAAMLLIMAVLAGMTGARASVRLIRISPIVLLLSAAALFIGTLYF